jgi:hypothetical protein
VCGRWIIYTSGECLILLAVWRVKHPRSSEPEVAEPAPKASLLHVVRIVVSLLFMIGRNRDYGPQAPVVTPARLIIVSLIGAALLVAGLITLASFIAR